MNFVYKFLLPEINNFFGGGGVCGMGEACVCVGGGEVGGGGGAGV